MEERPIGMFDSGVGGTSIWKEIRTLLPRENIIYLADSANAPYGEKGPEEILRLSVKNTEWLLERDCKIIVVACNTATTNAIAHLRKHYPIPFIGIEPAIKPAALNSRTKKVGVLATHGTLSSALFHSTSQMHAAGLEIVEQDGKGLVPLLEAGQLHGPEMRKLLELYLRPMIQANIDYLVLGCTHYPYLVPLLRTILPQGVTIIDSGAAVARQTKKVLGQLGLLNLTAPDSRHAFYTNGSKTVLEHFVGPISKNVSVSSLPL
ncbi:glutamate racemase [Maribacter sp. 2307ULW6-5]|uniref:glutamate racemase n=1 Tax=Maribacter sp. 2307ULW6-5 TaxID=3386275 RepID=UPI0039BD3704